MAKIKVSNEMIDAAQLVLSKFSVGCDGDVLRQAIEAALAVRSKKPAPAAQAVLLTTLCVALPAHYAQALIDHRIAKRCPLTPLAAELLAKELLKTGNPTDACEMILNRGWQGFKASWYDREQSQERGAARGNFNGGGLSNARAQLAQEIADDRHSGAQGPDYRDARYLPLGR